MTLILVTRPAAQAEGLVERLAALGIDAISVPTVAVEAADLDLALPLTEGTEWLVVTSANGAAALEGVILPAATRVAAVGPATAATLRQRGIRVDHVPDEYLTVNIADGLGDVSGRRIVLARADAATPDLRKVLLGRGALVEEVVAYRTIEGPEFSRVPLHAALRQPLDGVAFTSGSTVRGFVALDGPTTLRAFCIGPVTAAEAIRAGLRVSAIAQEHTAGGLAAAIADYFSKESS